MRAGRGIAVCLLLGLCVLSSNAPCDPSQPNNVRGGSATPAPFSMRQEGIAANHVKTPMLGRRRSGEMCRVGGLQSMRGGAGGGAKTKIEGTSRKGFWIGLRRSEDGGKVIYEDPALYDKRLEEEENRTRMERASRQVEDNKKHRDAGLVVSEAIYAVIDACKPGVNVSSVCLLGDMTIREIFRRKFPHLAHLVRERDPKELDKFSSSRHGSDRERVRASHLRKGNSSMGVAHPTCVSVNNMCGKTSPLPAHDVTIQDGDLVKIDMSCHIDGNIASIAHTILVGEKQLLPRQADVILASKAAALVAMRSMRHGVSAMEVAEKVEREILLHDCHAVDGSMTRRVNSDEIDGSLFHMIPHRYDHIINDNREIPPDCILQQGEVWLIDMVVSTGDGQVKMKSSKETTIFRRMSDHKWIHLLKMQYSKDFLNKVIAWSPFMPFHMRDFPSKEDRAGLSECIKRGLLLPYPVLYDRRKAFVAHTKLTVLIEEEGVSILAAPPPHPQHELEPSYLRPLAAAGKDAAAPGRMLDEGEEEVVPTAEDTAVSLEMVEKLRRVIEKLSKGEEEMHKILQPTRQMRRSKVSMEARDEEGKTTTMEFSEYVVAMCSKFVEPTSLCYRFLDGDAKNTTDTNKRWVVAVQVFDAAMLRGEVWATDLRMGQRRLSRKVAARMKRSAQEMED